MKRGTRYSSLRVTSPVLNFLVVMAMIGKPMLEYFKEHQLQADAISPTLFLPLVLLFLACIYATVGVTVYFYYRAIENINFFTGARVRAPPRCVRQSADARAADRKRTPPGRRARGTGPPRAARH